MRLDPDCDVRYFLDPVQYRRHCDPKLAVVSLTQETMAACDDEDCSWWLINKR